MHFVRNSHRVAVRLPIDIQEDGRLSIRGHDGVDGFDRNGLMEAISRSLIGDAGRRRFDYDAADLGRIVHLAAHQTQDELMILLEQTWRVDEITFRNGIEMDWEP